MFLLHKTRWEVFFGRNSGMYVLKKEKTFGVLNGFLFTQVYWIRVKAHLLTLSHIPISDYLHNLGSLFREPIF